MLVLPFGIIGLADWTAPTWYITLPATAGVLIAAVTLTSGIRVLTGRQDRLATALIVGLAITACVSPAQQLTNLPYFPPATSITCTAPPHAGPPLLSHPRSVGVSPPRPAPPA